MNQISSRSSCPGVNHESTAMIWKQRPSYPNGSWLALHAQRRCSKVEPRSRPFQLSFLIVVHYEYAPPGQTINKEYCANALLWLGDAIRLKWPQLQATGDRSFITTMCLPMHHISCRDFCETSNHPGDSAPLQPRFGALRLLAFPKTKITFEREDISDPQWDLGKYDEAAVAIPTKDFAECFEQWKRCWENCVRSQGVYIEGDWGIIVLYTMFLVSCVFFNNVSIFHIIWRGIFRTDLVYLYWWYLVKYV